LPALKKPAISDKSERSGIWLGRTHQVWDKVQEELGITSWGGSGDQDKIEGVWDVFFDDQLCSFLNVNPEDALNVLIKNSSNVTLESKAADLESLNGYDSSWNGYFLGRRR
jgi:hypothetical protein